MFTNPSVSDFKSYFNRDFPYGGTNGDLSTIQDSDILKAQIQQQGMINQGLFSNQSMYTVGANLLAAHILVQNLRASAQGIAGKFEWAVASKSVGAVASSFSIPQRILDNPELSIYSSTVYGVQYLGLVLPGLTGQMFTAADGTIGPGQASYFGGVWGSVGPWAGCVQAPMPQTPDDVKKPPL